MKGKTALIGVTSMLVFAGSAARISAHDNGLPPLNAPPETCLKPLKPIIAAFVETGNEGELRREFELYFKEVETYLGCLNAESHRVREEAKQAAYEFDSVLDRVPLNRKNQPEITPLVPMVSSGHLNLNYKGSGG